jgi:hypothetical protein
MSTNSPAAQLLDLNDPELCEADAKAVLAHVPADGALDPAIVARVRARAAQITEDIRQARGVVDDETFQSLLDDEA